ncbi:hypothetical protein [Nocardioides donggukensis]|uniref:Allene oxide cyclase barrel-like domain-containing protein n=1 Tax=Nocardioides donggukensis TaxID=2774019 RepID=A0A927PZ06_9ACTN|nr:hypothetical protein [Nocardioides donggukensis]MBD8869323.1 hypothetical protein [Nocardioides donggukensis]
MRTSHLVATATLALGLVAGTGGTAWAGGVERFTLPDEQFPVDNPCTGASTLLTLTDQQLLVREAEDGNGAFHITQHVAADWHTEDGFSGRFRDNFGVTDADPGTFTDFVLHQQVRFVGRNASGRVAKFRGSYVVRQTPDGPRAQVEFEEATCVGR